MLATGEGTGAVSWLDFAFRLMYLPIGLFGVSIATAATPAISRMVAEQDFPRIRSTLASALGLMFFLNLPATIGLIVLARPIVAVIFEHGEFTASDTIATAAALQLYAIGLIGYSIVRIISPTFYAARPQPGAGDGVGGVGASSTWRSTSRWCGVSAIAAWRSAPRSPRSSTPRAVVPAAP